MKAARRDPPPTRPPSVPANRSIRPTRRGLPVRFGGPFIALVLSGSGHRIFQVSQNGQESASRFLIWLGTGSVVPEQWTDRGTAFRVALAGRKPVFRISPVIRRCHGAASRRGRCPIP